MDPLGAGRESKSVGSGRVFLLHLPLQGLGTGEDSALHKAK